MFVTAACFLFLPSYGPSLSRNRSAIHITVVRSLSRAPVVILSLWLISQIILVLSFQDRAKMQPALKCLDTVCFVLHVKSDSTEWNKGNIYTQTSEKVTSNRNFKVVFCFSGLLVKMFQPFLCHRSPRYACRLRDRKDSPIPVVLRDIERARTKDQTIQREGQKLINGNCWEEDKYVFSLTFPQFSVGQKTAISYEF